LLRTFSSPFVEENVSAASTRRPWVFGSPIRALLGRPDVSGRRSLADVRHLERALTDHKSRELRPVRTLDAADAQ
jgi:hypothetical protein